MFTTILPSIQASCGQPWLDLASLSFGIPFSLKGDDVRYLPLQGLPLKKPVLTAKKEIETPSRQFEEQVSKKRKRKLQVAEASRRSRARRKEEFFNIQNQNKRLLCEIVRLKSRLKQIEGKGICSLSDGETNRPGSFVSSMSCSSKPLPLEIEYEKTLATGKPQSEDVDKDYFEILSFLQTQTKEYFEQLKQDFFLWFKDLDSFVPRSSSPPACDLAVEIVEM